MKDRKIILVAQAASGKTYLAEEFERHGFTSNLSVTTRPMRIGEEHMKHYNFMGNLKFLWNKLLGRFWETKKFNGWRYGTLKEEWLNKDLFVFTPSGCKDIDKHDERENTFIVLIKISEDTRKRRLMNRGDADSAMRRIEADKEDFKLFWDFDMMVTNPTFDPEEVYFHILEKMDHSSLKK